MTTLTVVTNYTVVACDCGVRYALDDEFIRARKRDRKAFYCPNGCSRWFPGKTPEREAKELRAQLDLSRKTQDRLRDEIAHEQAVARGYKGALTKTKRRISRGVCPCCNRSFADVERHMAGQHPEYASGGGQP